MLIDQKYMYVIEETNIRILHVGTVTSPIAVGRSAKLTWEGTIEQLQLQASAFLVPPL